MTDTASYANPVLRTSSTATTARGQQGGIQTVVAVSPPISLGSFDHQAGDFDQVQRISSWASIPGHDLQRVTSWGSVTSNADTAQTSWPCYLVPGNDVCTLFRTAELEAIEAHFLDFESTNSRSTVVVSGIGGIGKSSLAVSVAYRLMRSEQYDAIFWLDAADIDVLRQSWTRVATRLMLKGADRGNDHDLNYSLVRSWLEVTKCRYALFFDNVQTYEPLNIYTPPNKGAMLVTTRSSRVAYAVGGDPMHIKLHTFSPDESLSFFNKIRQARDPQARVDAEETETRTLLEMIDGLPVGLKHVASYMAARKMSISAFERKYKQMAKHVLAHTGASEEQTLLKTWNVQFESIHGSKAWTLLGMLSLCRHSQVPRVLFEHEDELGFTGCLDGDELESAINELEDKALIDVESEDKALIEIPSGDSL